MEIIYKYPKLIMKEVCMNRFFFVFFMLSVFASQAHSQPISWTETQPAGAVNKYWQRTAVNFYGTTLIAGVGFGSGRLYVSTNSGSSWTETQPAGDANRYWYAASISADGAKMIAGDANARLYLSTNSGSSWTETRPSGDTNRFWLATSMSANGAKIAAGVLGGRLYLSTNTGSSWTETQPAGDANKNWRSISMSSDGTKMIAGAYGGRLYLSTNSGSSWTETQPVGNVDTSWHITSMSSDGSTMIAGAYGGRLYLSTNSGSSWAETQPAGNTDKNWWTFSMSSDGNKMIAGVNGGRIYISTNSGSSWNETMPAGNADANWGSISLSADGSKVIAGGNDGRLYLNNEPWQMASINFGSVAVGATKVDSIKVKNNGMQVMNIDSIVSNNALFVTSQGDTTIAVGDSVFYYVTFAPEAYESTAGTLKFYHDGSDWSFSAYVNGVGSITEPTVQASNIAFSSVTANSLTVHWSNGNGSKRIVLVKSGSAVNALPNDGSSYYGDPAFGMGETTGPGNYSVYSDETDTLVQVTGLNPGTNYHFAVIEYNDYLGGSQNYLTASPLTGTQATPAVVFDSTAGHALEFHNEDEGIDVGDLLALRYLNGTVEAWVKIPLSGAGSGYRGIISKSHHYELYLKDNVLIGYNWGNADNMGVESAGDYSTGISLNDNKWHHIAMTFTGDDYGIGAITIYLDGEMTSVSGSPCTSIETGSPLNIGYGWTGYSGSAMIGQIDEVKIWNTVRTAEQIRNDMHCTPSGTPSGLVASYQFSESSGGTVHDVFGGHDGTLAGSPVWISSTAPVGKGSGTSVNAFEFGTATFSEFTVTTTEWFDSPVDLVGTKIQTLPNVLPSTYSSVAGNRYYVLHTYGTPGTIAANLSFTFGAGVIDSYFDAAPEGVLLYTRVSNSDSAWTLVGGAQSVNSTTGVVQFNNITSFSQFSVVQDEAAMPVELVSFSALPKQNNVELKWSTATEVNNYGFEVERKLVTVQASGQNTSNLKPETLNKQWQHVGFVEGSGTTNAPKEYSFTEKKVADGKYEYRLKQIDNDGTFKYSLTVEAEIKFVPTVFALSQNYPNPFNPSTTINYQLPVTSNVELKVFDMLGREVMTLVNEVKEAGSYDLKFDARSLASGIYFYRIHAADFVSIKKMLLVK